MNLRRSVAVVSLLFTLGYATGCGTTAPAERPSAPGTTGPAAVRIMPLGDSITGSPGCWRAILWTSLQATGRVSIDFVGSRGTQDCPMAYPPLYGPHDGDNEGHGGYLVTDIATGAELPSWLGEARPDIVLMHLGTNDVWSDVAPARILAAYSTVLAKARAVNPDVTFLVAQILPMEPADCAACGQRVRDLNGRIPGWASTAGTARSKVIVVDQWTGFDPAAATKDGVHPNNEGNQRIAAAWLKALEPLVPVTGLPSPTPF